MRRRVAVVALLFLAATYLFGGRYGLVAGAAMLAGVLLLRLPSRALWIGSLVLLGAAPIAIIVAGLPESPVVGAGFGQSHIAAHVLVGLAMAAAALAGMLEMAGWDAGARPARAPRRRVRSPAAGDDRRPARGAPRPHPD